MEHLPPTHSVKAKDTRFTFAYAVDPYFSSIARDKALKMQGELTQTLNDVRNRMDILQATLDTTNEAKVTSLNPIAQMTFEQGYRTSPNQPQNSDLFWRARPPSTQNSDI